jgi:hypothetical protein
MSRSVTAELELEAGEYDVLIKIIAEKIAGALAVEDVVRNNAKDRSDKLQRIGLAYDLAHAKGQLKETDEEKKLRKRLEARKKAKAQKEVKDKLMKEKQKRKHNENKELRKQRVAAEKRKAKAKAKASKKASKEKVEKEEREKKEKEGKEKKEKEEQEKKATETKEDLKAASETTPEKTLDTEKKPDGAKDSTLETPSQAPEILLNGSAPPLLGGFSDIDDDEDLSDIESVISDISIGIIDDTIAEAKLAADSAPPPPTNEDEDEFQKDPWNAIAVVGLRVYCNGGEVGVKVVRPKLTEEVLGKKKGGSETSSVVGLGDSKLDVDDSAKDATKGVESEVTVERKEEGEKKDGEGSQNSEGSVVIV